jgi:hypothetical protein
MKKSYNYNELVTWMKMNQMDEIATY